MLLRFYHHSATRKNSLAALSYQQVALEIFWRACNSTQPSCHWINPVMCTEYKWSIHLTTEAAEGKKSGHLETVVHVTHLKTPRKNSQTKGKKEREMKISEYCTLEEGTTRAVYLHPLLSSMAESLVFFCSNLQLGEFWRMQLNSNALMSNISSLHICLELFFLLNSGSDESVFHNNNNDKGLMMNYN